MSKTVNNDARSASSKNCEWLIQIKNAGTQETTTHDDNQRKGPDFQRVPQTFRSIQQNSYCYDPSVVSIGPYHHGKEKLEEMEKLKVTYAREFVKDTEKPLDETYTEVDAMLSIAKNRYPEEARRGFNDERLAKMMFIDGCFILQFLFCLHKPGNLKMSSHDAALVTKDLFLLENQLPFEVLNKLMSFRNLDHKAWMKILTDFCDQVRAFPAGTELKEKMTKIFRGLQKSLTIRNPQGIARDQPAPAAHLLELLHKQFCPGTILSENSEKSSCKNNSQKNWYRYYPAEELRNIGIHFKPSKTALFTDVQFKRRWLITRSLYIPPLRIDSSTKSLLLNLVAYEACLGASNESRVTSYVCFMDSLIDTPRDVQVLRSKGILLNTLGSDEQAAELFNQIASHLIPDPYAYIQVKSSIEKEHRKVIRKWVAMWLRLYFNSPWTFIAFVAATFTIILTAIQTYMALFPLKDR
ncbi:PREDICTED: UPF0481 protein At3g47200-like [Populus euphratica]|uniref:UPF0481 protein At3g47200-like n=1 Tax=Populus euphratica TaxID=75702 RepID=A0AAJ6WZR2_POPEU|nr:PREDICTED: UPF0481 protein At3g47200-like [Populus euphratica]